MKTQNHVYESFVCVSCGHIEGQDPQECLNNKAFLQYATDKTPAENLMGFVNKFFYRGAFGVHKFELVKTPAKFPHDGTPGDMDYGDEDRMIFVTVNSCENQWGGSPRGIRITGYVPVHVTGRGTVSYGWCKDGASSPKSMDIYLTLDKKEMKVDNVYMERLCGDTFKRSMDQLLEKCALKLFMND